MEKSKGKHILFILLKLIMTSLLVSILLMLYASIYMFSRKLPNNMIIYMHVIALVAIFIFAALIIWTKRFRSFSFKLLGIIFILEIGTLLGLEIYQRYEKSITIAVRDLNIDEYLPFMEESKIVRLPKESSFKITKDIPIVDGAKALFPVYFAFVDAVYPDNIGKLNEENSPLRYNNTPKGYEYLAQKKIDIFFGVYPNEEQIKYAVDENNTNFVFNEIGRDGFIFFVNKNNPVNSLTPDQIRDIYSGKIKNWKDVGGNDGEIIAYQRNEGSGSQSALRRFMNGIKIIDGPSDRVFDFMNGIISEFSDYKNSKNAIGFSFRYYAQEMVKNYDIKLLSINGIAPTADNIKTAKYPLIDSFYAVTYEGNKNPNVKKFIDWVLSVEGQYIIEKTGYVSLELLKENQ
ncbi:MAG: substrate-binding domain-containing protein [Fusobacteriaceae bacterium]|nr:substrate-binding domain-containing protein [Fusobacteriaceae bacterium]